MRAAASARLRISYQLTAEGKEHLKPSPAAPGTDTAEDDTFEVRFAFFARTEADIRRLILEGRRHRLQERLDAGRADRDRRREQADSWSAALAQHAEEGTEREVRWLSELIDAEKRHPKTPVPSPSRTDDGTGPRGIRTVEQPPAPPQRSTPDEHHPRRDRGHRQLRELTRAGRPLLQGRRPGRHRARFMHVTFGDYHVRDVQFVAAFDVDDKKVGKGPRRGDQLSENNTIKIAEVPTSGVTVQRGHTSTVWASTTG